MGWGNESLFAESWSHDQDGHHAHMVKTLKNLLLQNQRANDLVAWYVALGTRAKGLSAPGLGLYTCMKTLKHMHKIRAERDFFFKFATNGQSDKAFLLGSKF